MAEIRERRAQARASAPVAVATSGDLGQIGSSAARIAEVLVGSASFMTTLERSRRLAEELAEVASDGNGAEQEVGRGAGGAGFDGGDGAEQEVA